MAENPKNHGNIDSDPLIDDIVEKFDSATCLDSKPLLLSDLPNEILGEIVEKLDLVSRFKTRKVSRLFRSVVDKQNALYHKICIETMQNRMDITFDKDLVYYKNSENGCMVEYERFKKPMKETFIEINNFLEIAINDLAIALKKPKFRLEKLEILFNADADVETAKILEFLESLEAPINVKALKMRNHGSYDTLLFLSLLNPGTLEEINIRGMDKRLNPNELVKMDQWKRARIVYLGRFPIGVKDFLNFNRFDVYVDSISPHDVLRLRDTISKSTNFDRGCLRHLDGHFNVEEIAKTIGAKGDLHAVDPINFHCHPIPGSKEFLHFFFNRFELSIGRKPY